jgi:hypothetical protein
MPGKEGSALPFNEARDICHMGACGAAMRSERAVLVAAQLLLLTCDGRSFAAHQACYIYR